MLNLLGMLLAVVCQTQAIPSGYFWQINDFHVDPTYWTTRESCNEELHHIGKYGDYECDPPWELVTSSVKAMSDNGGTPDFIIWNGDSPPHMKNYSSMSEDIVINTLQNSTNIMKTYFPHTPFVVTLGNHDYYRKDQLPGSTNAIYDRVADMWADWLGSDDAIQTFKAGGYYTRLLPRVDPRLRAVVVNSNLYLANNEATEGQDDPGGQYAWLQEVLADAKTNQELVHLVLHVPMGAMEQPGNPKWLRKEDNARLNNIIRDNADVILGVYTAHQHFDTFRLLYKYNRPVAAMLIAPSVTPWRARITDNLRAAAHNPGVRKVSFDKFTMALTDVEQFYLKLDEANRHGDATWDRLYSARALYGLREITPQSLHQLTEKFKEFANEQFHQYHDMNALRSRHRSNGPCSCECKFEHICAIQHVDFGSFDQCKQIITCGARGLTASLLLGVLSLLCAFI